MTITRRRSFLAAEAMLLALVPRTGAAAKPVHRPTSSAEVWARTELYFGTNRPGGEVSDAEFGSFIDAEVTTRFPDGLTLLTGYGQFRASDGSLIREKSHVLILLYPAQTEYANEKIQEIRELYKKAHQQESVLRVDSNAAVSF